jgi:hypothetical protein
MLPGTRIGSSSHFWANPRTSPSKGELAPPERLPSIRDRISPHPCSKCGEHCFGGEYDSFGLILWYSHLQQFAEFIPHGSGSISIPVKVGIALTIAQMKHPLDMAGDESSSQLRSFHDIHRSKEAGKVVHLRKLGTSVISLGYSKPCQVALQQRPPLPCCESRLEPGWSEFCCPFFPGRYDSVNLLEALNILGYAETLVHQGNGTFDSTMVAFGFLSQLLHVQIATLLGYRR